MSAFDLAADHDSLSLADQARANPLDLSQPAGFFSGMGTGAVTGVGRLLADTQRTTGLALGAVAGSFDMLTGDAIKAQEKVFEHIVTPADKLSRHLAPKPEEIGMAGQLLHVLIKIGGEAVAFGAPGVLALETVGGTLDALDKGVDLQTAAKVGGVQGAAMTAGVIAPMTLGASGLGMNVLYGAGINLALGVFLRGATSEIYAKAGRHDLAMQFKALDGEAMAVDAILGAAFAGGGRALQLRGEKAKADAVAEYRAKIADLLKPEQIDAALVKNEQLKMERSGFGLPADLPSRDAHVANMNGAIDDLIEGRPVTMRQEVGDMLPDDAAAKVQADVAEVLRADVEPKVGADGQVWMIQPGEADIKPAPAGDGTRTAPDAAQRIAELNAKITELEGYGGISVNRVDELRAERDALVPARQDGTNSVVPDSGMTILHGSGNANLTADGVQIIRQGQKQGKKGRTYGGLYGTSESDIAQAEGYASMMGGEATLYNIRVRPGTKVLNKVGDITRLSEKYINELVSQGYGVVVGKDPRGRTEYVVIDTNAIESMQPNKPKVSAGGTAARAPQSLPPDVERSALKKASEVQNEKDALDIAEEVRSLEEGGGVDLSKLFAEPKFWDSENEQWTPEGLVASNAATRAQAIENLRLRDITELSDLNLANHKAQYAAMLEILDGLGIHYTDTSSAQSKYIEVGGYKLRFADHANQVRDSAVRGSLPVLNVAPGESTFADALRVVMESTPTANKIELSQGLPRDGMQERAVRADKSGSPEPAQSDGAVGGDANVSRKVGAGTTAANDLALDPWNEPQAPRTFEQRIGDENIRSELLRMKGETGWAEVGGRMIRQQDDGGNETITRTAWVPNAEWWPGRPKGLKETDLHKAIDKAVAGEKLNPAERRAVEYMADVAEQRQKSSAWKPTGDELAETGLASHNELDVAMTARAAEINPDAVESLATRFESDDAGFMRGIKELLDEHDRQAVASRQEGQRAPDSAITDAEHSVQSAALRPDAVIPLDDADATATVAEAQGIIADLETARAEQDVGLRAAVACFLRAA